MSPLTEPVIVVGAGPTGLMLACELRLAGVPVVIVERNAVPDPHSPGQAVNSAVMDLLDQRGLAGELRASGRPLPGAHFSLVWLEPERLTGPPRPRGLLVAQSRLEALLERRAVESGARILRGREVVDLRQSADGVTVRLRATDREPAGDELLHGSYLVAADGTRSTVRRLAGIGFPGSDWTVSGTVGDVEADFADLAADHLGAFHTSSGGVYSGSPAGPDVLRVITVRFDDGTPDAGPVALDDLQQDVRALTGRPLPARRLVWAKRFTSVNGNAEGYRAGRVFLAGDAAHSFFPLGGLRLSTCLQDAVNLGWKLAAELAGWAPPGLLDTYHAERHPEGERARLALDAQLAMMDPPGRSAGIRSLITRLAWYDDVNRHLVDLVTGADVRYPVAADGGSEPDERLGGRLAGTAPLLRGGRGLLLVPDEAAAALADTAAGWADRVDTVTASAAADGPAAHGPAAEGPAAEATPVLLRPDGHVVWTEGAGTLEAALKTWFGAPR
ncbi:hypothetical protein AMK31_06725 [Streptomyces sp. TSRI0107]|nr:hypothetical protein AMK31_06725 [Streptomyces sp. TSRI0107]